MAQTVTQAMEQIVEVVQMHIDVLCEQSKPLPSEVMEVNGRAIKTTVAVSVL